MKKLIIIVVLLGAAVFAGIYFLTPHESTPDSLKKALADDFGAFSVAADYMKSQPENTVLGTDSKKPPEQIASELKTLNEAGILDIRTKNGTVIFNTGTEVRGGSEHYLIYSPSGKPSAYPDADDAGRDGW